jgi:hypothetical protein
MTVPRDELQIVLTACEQSLARARVIESDMKLAIAKITAITMYIEMTNAAKTKTKGKGKDVEDDRAGTQSST